MQNIIENIFDSIQSGLVKKVVARDQEIQRLIEILCRSQKCHPMIIGKFGVGCTSVAEGLAWRIHEEQVPKQLKDTNFFRINFPLLINNPDFSFNFLKTLFQKVQLNEKPTILIFDDFDHLQDVSQGLMSTIFAWAKQLLLQKNFKIIFICNSTFYKQFIAIDKIFSQMCVPLLISEPSFDQTIEMLKAHTAIIKKTYHIEIDETALEHLVTFSQIYCPEKRLPSSAIDLLDHVAARLSSQLSKNLLLKKEDVIDFLNDLMGIPKVVLSTSFKEKFSRCANNLDQFIFGQALALSKIQQALQISEIQIRPFSLFSVLLFVGPSGVGKAHTAKILNDILYGLPRHYLRIDLENYTQPTDVEKLIGPYRTNIDGELVRQIKKTPYSVCVFENIEFAHPDVLRGLEAVLTKGTIGRYSLSKIIAIFTTTYEENAALIETEEDAAPADSRLQLVANDLPGIAHEITGLDMRCMIKTIQSRFKNSLSHNFLQKISMIPFAHLTEDALIDLIDFHLQLLVTHFQKTQNITLSYSNKLPDIIFATLSPEQHTPKDIEHQLLSVKPSIENKKEYVIKMNEKSQLIIL